MTGPQRFGGDGRPEFDRPAAAGSPGKEAVMSTATRGKKGHPPTEMPAPRRRRRRWLFTTTVLIGLPTLVWFAPTIVAFGPL